MATVHMAAVHVVTVQVVTVHMAAVHVVTVQVATVHVVHAQARKF